MESQASYLPLIGDKAPYFRATTTEGEVTFPNDYKGKWVILFSHPGDFTPVCTTEFMIFAKMQEDFRELNTELIGLSVDSVYSHIAWLQTIKEKIRFHGMENVEIGFPVIEDLRMEVSRLYGMIQPNESNTSTVRAVFVIDPEGIVRAMMYYPLSCGRNIEEIKRLLLSLQKTDRANVSTPANWMPGDDVIVAPPGTCGTVRKRSEKPPEDLECVDWFLCLKEDIDEEEPKKEKKNKSKSKDKSKSKPKDKSKSKSKDKSKSKPKDKSKKKSKK